MKRFLLILLAPISLMQMGQPFLIGISTAITGSAVMLAFPAKLKADNASYYFFRGVQKGELQGDHLGAISELTKAIELSPKFGDAYQVRGWNKSQIGDYVGAINDYKIALQLDSIFSNDSDIHYALGNVYGKMGNYEGAISNYSLAIDLDPPAVFLKSAHNRRGITYYRLGNIDEALFDFNLAILLDSNFGRAYLFRGLAYKKTGYMKKACDDWRKAASLKNLDAAELVSNEC